MSRSILAQAESCVRHSSIWARAGYGMAVMASGALICLSYSAAQTCSMTRGSCGTPCASAFFLHFFAPVILSLPYRSLLTMQGLPPLGLVARCCVTCGLAVWGLVTFLVFGGM